MNDKILEMAPYTVGIIVGRALIKASKPDTEACPLRGVAVFFIGRPGT